MLPYSLLDLAPVPEGATAGQALANSLDLARHAESWGYNRYWLAEHHNMPGIASAATAVVIGHIAAGTSRIRVGSGGIMLPNHAPLMVAEAFGTLATLYPDRIDLGLGRAPGTDGATAQALRRYMDGADSFPQDVMELMQYFEDPRAGAQVVAHPGAGTHVPVWMLGSSLFGAQLAAHLGLPYAFASHFAPQALGEAVRIYRDSYRPSAQWPTPYFMLAVNVFAGKDDAEGEFLKSSMRQAFVKLRTGEPGKLPAPTDDFSAIGNPTLLRHADQALSVSATGAPATVKAQLQALVNRFKPEEVILNGQIFDHAKRLRSFEIAAEVMQDITLPVAATAQA
ncbi:LLM class flavin-dependent oxidoreductase [Thioclava sp. BHET1]|nr:LLM class flavin-dependent oxidoreductase [Thioclava sp. BHET1]